MANVSRCLNSALALALALTSSGLLAQEGGPFGLHRGMSQEQVIRIVGKGAVKETKDGILAILTVPKPHPAFERYDLIFSPKDGL